MGIMWSPPSQGVMSMRCTDAAPSAPGCCGLIDALRGACCYYHPHSSPQTPFLGLGNAFLFPMARCILGSSFFRTVLGRHEFWCFLLSHSTWFILLVSFVVPLFCDFPPDFWQRGSFLIQLKRFWPKALLAARWHAYLYDSIGILSIWGKSGGSIIHTQEQGWALSENLERSQKTGLTLCGQGQVQHPTSPCSCGAGWAPAWNVLFHSVLFALFPLLFPASWLPSSLPQWHCTFDTQRLYIHFPLPWLLYPSLPPSIS